MSPLLVVFGGVFLVLLCLGFALHGIFFAPRNAIAGRVEGIARRVVRTADMTAVPESVIRQRQQTNFVTLDKVLRQVLPDPQALTRRLERTGKDISIGGYAAVSLGVATIAGASVWWFFGIPGVMSSLIGVIAGVGLPHMVIGFLGKRRTSRFLALLPDAIELIVRGLKSGLPISECINSVATEFPAPIGSEFRLIVDRVQLGQNLEESLWVTANRLEAPDFKFFVISLSVQKETGGNLGETLANLADILRKRKQMKLKIKALSSEARASAYILGALPFLMFAILMLINTDYTMTLFTDPRGHLAMGAGLFSLALGVAVMFKMVRFEI